MRRRSENHRERGSALLVAMLMLALMGIIGIASLETVARDRQVAGFGNLAQSALYAADAGIAESLDLLRQEIVGAALTQGDCLTADIMDEDLANRPHRQAGGARIAGLSTPIYRRRSALARKAAEAPRGASWSRRPTYRG